MSLEESFATKYRPKKLSQIIGQPVVKKAFQNAFKYNTMHHAYILAGQFGCGKTSIARIIAATENCEKGGDDPCGVCDNCKEIFEGKSFEVHEIDAGSKGNVDDIRDLQKVIQMLPVKCKTRYVIIDEAHSLSGHAAEASLKMIEEPPKRVRFVLCTTEPQKFKETIHSRCITWTLSKVTPNEIFEHLKDIANREKILFDEQALFLIARNSKGSVRNSLHNLQTVVNYSGKNKISTKEVVDALGEVDGSLYFVLTDAVIKQKYLQAVQAVQAIFLNGASPEMVIDGVYRHLNNLLMVKLCSEKVDYFHFTEAELKFYSEQSKSMSSDIVLRMMTLLNEVAIGLNYGLDAEKLFLKFIVDCIRSKSVEKSD